MVVKHIQHQPGAYQHADRGADLGFALDDFTVAPITQDRAKQTVVFEPGTQARRAFGRGPGSEQNEFGGRQAGNHDGDQANTQTHVGQQAKQHASYFRRGLSLLGHKLKTHERTPGQPVLTGQVKLKPVPVQQRKRVPVIR